MKKERQFLSRVRTLKGMNRYKFDMCKVCESPAFIMLHFGWLEAFMTSDMQKSCFLFDDEVIETNIVHIFFCKQWKDRRRKITPLPRALSKQLQEQPRRSFYSFSPNTEGAGFSWRIQPEIRTKGAAPSMISEIWFCFIEPFKNIHVHVVLFLKIRESETLDIKHRYCPCIFLLEEVVRRRHWNKYSPHFFFCKRWKHRRKKFMPVRINSQQQAWRSF